MRTVVTSDRQQLRKVQADPGLLKSTIEDLEPDQQMMLVALMWLGRGDFALAEWDEAMNHAENSWNDHTADYLIGTALLGDYLADGLGHFEAQETD